MKKEKTEKKPDRRVAKTQKAIREALLSLMEEKEIEKITMKEIAERADVDRKTVYNYYSGIHAVHEALGNELIRQFETVMADVKCDVNDPYSWFEGLTKLLQENMELYNRIVHLKNNQHLIYGIIRFLRQKIFAAIDGSKDIPEDKKEMAATFVTLGTVSAYYQWFSSEEKCSLHELSDDIYKLVMEGLTSLLKK